MWCNLLYFLKKCANEDDVRYVVEYPIIRYIIAHPKVTFY
jgi:hypothetical protein